jgi:CrcB protein
VGGGLGASARWQIDLMALRSAPVLSTTIPISTWTVNCVGAFLLGALLVLLDRGRPHPLLRPFLAVGFLGSFTTFSAFALESRALAGQFGTPVGAGHAVLMVATGYLAYAGGAATARRGSGTERHPRSAP